MKRHFRATFAALALTAFFMASANPVCASQLPDATVQAPDGTEQDPAPAPVTVSFVKNGGKGSMESLSVPAGTDIKLPKNTFTKAGFQFTGWSTDKDGNGTACKDGDTIQAPADGGADEIVLYAQWQLKAPALKTAKSPSPELLKVTYAKNSYASGHEIQYATSKTFKKAASIEAGKKSTSASIQDITPGKKYYIRMRSYQTANGVKKYSRYSKTLSVTVKKGAAIVNTRSYMAISANVKLNGSGSGCHAKLVMAAPTSAVSYGIQFDRYAQAPYTGKAMAMIENVSTNATGGQRYTRPGDKELKRGKTYHMMMAVDRNGNGSVYLDYQKIGSFSQPNLAGGACALRIEASARRNGDSVDAAFSNIKCKWYGAYDPDRGAGKNLSWYEFKQNPGLSYTVQKDGGIRIQGTIQGIAGDWDSDYDRVSDILQFQ